MKASTSELDRELFEKIANHLYLMAHPTRIGIIELLLQHEKLSVTEIYRHIKIEQSLASNHLRILKECGVLDAHRLGKKIFYSVKIKYLKNLMDCANRCNDA